METSESINKSTVLILKKTTEENRETAEGEATVTSISYESGYTAVIVDKKDGRY